MKELCDADSSADEPTEESADKSDPGSYSAWCMLGVLLQKMFVKQQLDISMNRYYGVPRSGNVVLCCFYIILWKRLLLFNYGIGIHLLQSEDPKNMPKICQINPKDNHISFQCKISNMVKNEDSGSPSWSASLFMQTIEDVARAVAAAAAAATTVRSPRPYVVFSSKDDNGNSPLHKLQHQVSRVLKGFSQPPEVKSGTYNPEVLTSQKRQWASVQLQSLVFIFISSKTLFGPVSPCSAYFEWKAYKKLCNLSSNLLITSNAFDSCDHRPLKEPSRLFESMVVVGLHPNCDIQALQKQYFGRKSEGSGKFRSALSGQHQSRVEPNLEPQVLLKYKDLLSFGFPGGVEVHTQCCAKAYYLAVPFPIEKAPIREITTLNGGVKISELLNYPVRGLVFEGGNTLEDLSNAVSDSCICLQDNIQVGALCLGLVGKVDFTVRHLSSETASFPSTWDFSSSQQCIGGSGVHQCSAYSASASSETTWTMRTTFPEYVVALATIVGSVLFTKARELKKAADALRQEEKSGSKGRKWRKNVKAVEKGVASSGRRCKGFRRDVPSRLIVSVAWIAHIVIYLLINPPLSPFLNGVFIKLDDVWGLLGTAAFAFFCFYLLLAVIAGAMMLGMRLVFITIHPMKWGATLMNSFLFNVGLILLCSIRYCSLKEAASAAYAQVCAPYHTWAVRTAVYAGMCALPTWEQLLLKLNENGEIVIPL
ncbi:unnamed protein product [Camellia sinensis]